MKAMRGMMGMMWVLPAAMAMLEARQASAVEVVFTKQNTSLLYYAASADGGVADYLRKDTIGIAVEGILDNSNSTDSLTLSVIPPAGWSQAEFEAYPIASYDWTDNSRRYVALTASGVNPSKGTSQTIRLVVEARFVNWPTVETDTLTITTYALSRELLPEKDARIAALTQSLADTLRTKNAAIAEKDAKIAALVKDTMRLFNRLQLLQYDTTHVPVTVYDTTHVPVAVHDTTRVHDTIHLDTFYVWRDTVRVIDTVTVHVPGDTIRYPVELPSGDTVYDSVHIPVTVYDTVYVDTIIPTMVEWIRIYVDGTDVHNAKDMTFSDSVSVIDGVVTGLDAGQIFSIYNFDGVRLLTDTPSGSMYIVGDKLPVGWYILITNRAGRLIAVKFRL